MPAATTSTKKAPLQPVAAEEFPLAELHLDLDNPRFGGIQHKRITEKQLVNTIADEHDLTDVLSSISSNGYFKSEPLIGVRNKRKQGGITIIEGNRRLAACLILAGDDRASDQAERRELYSKSQFKPSHKLPVFVYDWSKMSDRRQLLPYLGIRHIVGPLSWDSFAKAAWVHSVLEQQILTLDEITRMVGDKNRTMIRLLDGYYFAVQVEKRAYDPNSSNRRGRGSKPEYPFSWVYNALDYDDIRKFVGLGTRKQIPQQDPVDKEHLRNASELMTWMFGGKGKAATIGDSREIKDLAQALSHPTSLRELRKGERLASAIDSARPKTERIKENLEEAADLTEAAFGLLIGVTPDEAEKLAPSSNRVFQAAREVKNRLTRLQEAEEGDGGDKGR